MTTGACPVCPGCRENGCEHHGPMTKPPAGAIFDEVGINPKDLVGAKKAPLEGVPAAGAIFAAPAHAVGHEKYGPFNWREKPVQVMSYIGAIYRHLGAYVDGQDFAEDTGVHHLAHALAGLNIIADSMGLGILIDNRPPKGPAADMLRAQDRSQPQPSYEDRSPWVAVFDLAKGDDVTVYTVKDLAMLSQALGTNVETLSEEEADQLREELEHPQLGGFDREC